MSRTPTRAPRSVLVVAVLGIAFLALPVVGLLQRAPWSSLDDLLGRRAVLDALRVSLTVSAVAASIVVVLGTPLAWMLTRVDIPMRRLVRALVILPMVLPPVVGGTALLFALGRRGLQSASGWTAGSTSRCPSRWPEQSWPPPSSPCRST